LSANADYVELKEIVHKINGIVQGMNGVVTFLSGYALLLC